MSDPQKALVQSAWRFSLGPMIPSIDARPLFGPPGAARGAVDLAILMAATDSGFMTLRHLPDWVPIQPVAIDRLLKIFALPQEVTNRLWRQKFAGPHANVYRGWFPLQDGHQTYKEGYDLGPDIAYGPSRVDPNDPLTEATPLPPADLLPGWQEEISRYYKAMEEVCATLLRAIARGLGVPEDSFAAAFAEGVSTLRLLHYPLRPERSFEGPNSAEIRVIHGGREVALAGKPHVNSGFVTLLCQHGVSGLQAIGNNGECLDVPPLPATLVVNFGKLLERWTWGRIKATTHRVIDGAGTARHSVPFFYEPGVNACISPIPGLGAPFEPFLYGDMLWEAMMRFVEFEGLDHLRKRA
ncbi:2OG-Fe(II) oxygenase family protein [Dongia sp.]|uniref:2OG-Fe(II) oxygenase family protein n=1 Tax=Dongia sp. TaxID=1977262 RepID=UPI0034A5B1E8